MSKLISLLRNTVTQITLLFCHHMTDYWLILVPALFLDTVGNFLDFATILILYRLQIRKRIIITLLANQGLIAQWFSAQESYWKDSWVQVPPLVGNFQVNLA